MLGRCRSIGMYKMDEDGENWYGLLVKIDKVREKQSEKEEQRRERKLRRTDSALICDCRPFLSVALTRGS